MHFMSSSYMKSHLMNPRCVVRHQPIDEMRHYMLQKLLFVEPFYLVSQVTFAQQPKPPEQYDGYEPIVEEPEPNWKTAAYSCPLSIKTVESEYKFSWYKITWAGRPLTELRGAPRKYIPFKFQKSDEVDLICGYEGFSTSIILRLEGLTACGSNDKQPLRVVCWTDDPYAEKK